MPFTQHRSEVSDISLSILNSLENSWPVFASLNIESRRTALMTVEAVTESVLWLSDMGFIIYEAILRDGLTVQLRDAALTARGRAFMGSFPASWTREPIHKAA